MQTVATLCRTCICLQSGRVDFHGAVDEGICHYNVQVDSSSSAETDAAKRAGSGEARFVAVAPTRRSYRPEEPKQFHFCVRRSASTLARTYLSAHLVNDGEQILCQCDSRFVGLEIVFAGPEVSGMLTVHHPWLKPGEYAMDFFLMDGRAGVLDRFERACKFQVLPVLPFAHSAPEAGMSHGIALGNFEWSIDANL